MVSREDMGKWIEGRPEGGGRRLNLPESGAGSQARLGRRVAALLLDWLVCWLVNYLLFGIGAGRGLVDANGMLTLVVFVVENILLVATLGATIGHRALGLQVRRVAGQGSVLDAPVGFGRAAIRSVLLGLAIPAVVWDADGRGLHDKAAGTVIVRR